MSPERSFIVIEGNRIKLNAGVFVKPHGRCVGSMGYLTNITGDGYKITCGRCGSDRVILDAPATSEAIRLSRKS